MNTTGLIEYWTMEGATQDVVAHFRSTDHILAGVDDDPEPQVTVPANFRVRGSDEEEWTPLLLDAEQND